MSVGALADACSTATGGRLNTDWSGWPDVCFFGSCICYAYGLRIACLLLFSFMTLSFHAAAAAR